MTMTTPAHIIARLSLLAVMSCGGDNTDDGTEPTTNACTESAAHMEECGFEGTPVPDECSGYVECAAKCVAAAPCDAIRGEVMDEVYNACAAACHG
jgi:hypothetical protein